MAISSCQSMPYPAALSRAYHQGTRSYAFSKSTKHANTSFAYSHDFSKICFRVKIWAADAIWTKTTLAIFQYDSTISRHFLLRHLAHTFPGRQRSDIPQYFVHSLRSPYLYFGMITFVCQSFGVFQVSTPPDIPLSTNTLLLRSFLDRISTFQVGFLLHQQSFRIAILVWLLPLLSI